MNEVESAYLSLETAEHFKKCSLCPEVFPAAVPVFNENGTLRDFLAAEYLFISEDEGGLDLCPECFETKNYEERVKWEEKDEL